MYTVLQIMSGLDEADDLAKSVAEFNVRSGPRGIERRVRGDGYAIELCADPLWSRHVTAITDFIRDNRTALSRVRSAGASLFVDVAVEPEDRTGRLLLELGLSEELITEFASSAVLFKVSIYAGPDDEDPALKSAV